jgi:hypothetical protein
MWCTFNPRHLIQHIPLEKASTSDSHVLFFLISNPVHNKPYQLPIMRNITMILNKYFFYCLNYVANSLSSDLCLKLSKISFSVPNTRYCVLIHVPNITRVSYIIYYIKFAENLYFLL